MSEIEIIADGGCPCRPAAEKPRIVEETLSKGESIAPLPAEMPDLLHLWCKLILESGSITVTGDYSVSRNKTVRELERQPGRKTLEKRSSRKRWTGRGIKIVLACAIVETGDLP